MDNFLHQVLTNPQDSHARQIKMKTNQHFNTVTVDNNEHILKINKYIYVYTHTKYIYKAKGPIFVCNEVNFQ